MNMYTKFTAVIAFSFFLISPGVYSQVSTQRVLTLCEAEAMVKAAEQRAKEDNWNVAISIVDAGGHLICLHKMDGTQVGSVEVSQKKAKAAVFYKRPTKVFQDQVSSGNNAIMLLPNVIASEGGVPIMHEEKAIGAIGVSGVTAAQDGIIANAALEVLESN
jgi:uncharacterized protein GlcG (DUF336 family)